MSIHIPIENTADVYVVKKGDTLYSIAKNNNISLENLKIINNLTSDLLKEGQILSLDFNKYIVKDGDTLWSIGKKFNILVNELKDINNLKNDVLSIGQVLNTK